MRPRSGNAGRHPTNLTPTAVQVLVITIWFAGQSPGFGFDWKFWMFMFLALCTVVHVNSIAGDDSMYFYPRDEIQEVVCLVMLMVILYGANDPNVADEVAGVLIVTMVLVAAVYKMQKEGISCMGLWRGRGTRQGVTPAAKNANAHETTHLEVSEQGGFASSFDN